MKHTQKEKKEEATKALKEFIKEHAKHLSEKVWLYDCVIKLNQED